MADTRQTLDIPHGVSFTIAENTITLGNEADVVIRGDLGYKMKRVFSKDGNVQILPPEGSVLNIEELEARKGDVHIQGHVNTKVIRAKKVFFDEGFLRADRIEGDDEVHLKGKRFQVLLTKAPTVTIDKEAKGLALVVECKHDVPEGRFMGGFPNMEEAKKTFSSFMDAVGGEGSSSSAPSAGTGSESASSKPTGSATTTGTAATSSSKSGGTAGTESKKASASAGSGSSEDDDGTSEQIKKFFQKT